MKYSFLEVELCRECFHYAGMLGIAGLVLNVLFWVVIALFARSWRTYLGIVAAVTLLMAGGGYMRHLDMAERLGFAPRSFMSMLLLTGAVEEPRLRLCGSR